MIDLELRLLGVPSVSQRSVQLALPTRKAIGLVAYLALEGPTERSELAGLLWSDFDPETARKNLRQELHRLAATPINAMLLVTPTTVGFRAPPETDVARFRRLAAAGDLEGARDAFGEPLLSQFELRGASGFDDWLIASREALSLERNGVLERHAGALEAGGDHRAALETYLELLEADGLRERYHCEAIRLHARLGEREAALAQFERCRKMLRSEFGLEPLPQTVAVAERVRAGEPQKPIDPPAQSNLPPLETPLVGRQNVWDRLERALGAGRTVIVSGEAGVGKSRLLREFAATRGRFHTNRGQPSDAGVPFATLSRSMREVLMLEPDLELSDWVRRELSRLVPELSGEVAPPLGSEADRLRLFEAFVEFLRAAYGRFDLLLSDDLHDFDASSLEMGNYAAARLTSMGLARPALASVRFEALAPPIRAQLEQLARAGQVELVELEPFQQADVVELVERLSGQRTALFSHRLCQATGGNVFFLLETLRYLFEAGELRARPGGGWATPYDEATEDYRELPIPSSVREAVLARVERLGPATRRLLDVASLAGEPFALETLAGASALSEWEALEALERAAGSRLVREVEGRHRFAHDLVRRALADDLGGDRRRLIHRRLAASLEREGGTPAVIAAHLELAGRDADAARWWIRAAEAALGVYALRDALAHYGRALELLPNDAPDRFAPLLEYHMQAYRLGEHAIMASSLEELERIASGTPERARVANQRAVVRLMEGETEGALSALESALELFTQAGDGNGRGRTLTNLGIACYRAGRFAASQTHIAASVGLARTLNPDRLGMALHMQGYLHVTFGDLEAALACFDEGLELMRASSDTTNIAHVQNARATAMCVFGSFESGLEGLEAPLARALESGARYLEAYVRLTRSTALLGLKRPSEASADLETALAIARETVDRDLVCACLNQRAQILLVSGDASATVLAATEAIEAAERLPSDRAVALTARSAARLALGDRDSALADAQRAAQLLESMGGLREFPPEVVRLVYARSLEASGRADDAFHTFERARSEVRARLERIRDPGLRRAYLETDASRILLKP